MSILVQNEYGWFVCSKKYFDSIYESCIDRKLQICSFQILKDFFNIKTPFVMKSSAVKIAERLKKNEPFKVLRKKKKCKQNFLPLLPTASDDSLIKEAVTSLIKLSSALDYLEDSSISSEEWFKNNDEARDAAKKVPLFSSNQETLSYFHNQRDRSIVTAIGNEDYILPPLSTFHLCDVHYFPLKEKEYDLILLDPPWENKSVKRKKGYESLKFQSMIDIPIKELCKQGCLIAVWVTNNEKQISFVKDELFPKWNVISCVIWHWAKITRKGHFIYSIDSQHKKPYENLMLGRVAYDGEEKLLLKELEHNKTIVSVPSSIHSHKPPLVEVLQPYLSEDPNCLEIFARYLLPKWTSVGNEVLKLQNIKLFKSCPKT